MKIDDRRQRSGLDERLKCDGSVDKTFSHKGLCMEVARCMLKDGKS